MDLSNLPLELERARTKLTKIDARRERTSGWGATTGGQALTRRYHDRLTEAVSVTLLAPRDARSATDSLVSEVRTWLPPELISLCAIQAILHSIGNQDMFLSTLKDLGVCLSNELWGAKMAEIGPRLAARVTRAAQGRHGSLSKRIIAAKKKGLELGVKDTVWGPKELVSSGAWLWNIVSMALPDVFKRSLVPGANGHATYQAVLSTDAWDIVAASLSHSISSSPVYWPIAEAPKAWTNANNGGSWDPRVNGRTAVLRSHHKETHAAVRGAIKAGTMQPALDAINALQGVPYMINASVLEVLQGCIDAGIKIAGLVPDNIPRPLKPFDFQLLEKGEQALHWKKCAEVDVTNLGYVGDRVQFEEDLTIAYAMVGNAKFYVPMNCDWRGRIYGLSHFNFQREDRVRALFLFSEGLPIGDEGLRWLKIHTANTGDFDKISKRPLAERAAWCDDNIQQIMNTASEPLVHTQWMHADKPFLHLAACFELTAALARGPSFITRLPISFDGSCSGLQHLSAMTRAVEGSMVNLMSSETPQDIYQVIADDAFAAVTADIGTENEDLARLFLGYNGNRRTLVKRNVMTYAYSSKRFGMASQQQTDLMEVLSRGVLEGALEEHPFDGYQHGPYDKNGTQQPSKGARYIAGRIFDAIEARIRKPAEAMKFLQTIAKAMAHEGKPVTWTSPVGIPWINRYHPAHTEQLELFLNEGGIKLRTRLSIITGGKNEIDKAKAANGVAPNFVHALDAAHLLLVASAATAVGITSIATVHDSFGCLAPHATLFNKVIREQFLQMYEEHDVLAEILERASADLTEHNRNRLPSVPERGPLDLKEILNADFAFA
jgi:DNA-directed RNA polymerase, mitochondrial